MRSEKMLALGLALAALWGAPSLAGSKLKVVATYDVYAEVAREVGGESVQVTVLARGSQDPHYVDAKPSFLVALHKADALMLNGLDLEVGFLPPLLNQCGNARIQPGAAGYLDLSRLVEPIEVPQGGVDRSMGDIHPYGNPHYHLDPRNMARLARGVAASFALLDPPRAEEYRRGGEKLAQSYLVLDAELEARVAPLKSTPVVTYHSSLNYFFLRYQIPVAGFVEPKPGIKPSPSSLAELERVMKAKGVRVVATEPYQDLKIARRVAADTGARVAVVPAYTGGEPAASTYAGLMRTLVKGLLEASGG
jgi:zinc/manganese transport system substrate-binding protein